MSSLIMPSITPSHGVWHKTRPPSNLTYVPCPILLSELKSLPGLWHTGCFQSTGNCGCKCVFERYDVDCFYCTAKWTPLRCSHTNCIPCTDQQGLDHDFRLCFREPWRHEWVCQSTPYQHSDNIVDFDPSTSSGSIAWLTNVPRLSSSRPGVST